MAGKKGKSQKIHQAITDLEAALLEWDGIEEDELEKPCVEKDPQRQRTLSLLKELKEQLQGFEKDTI